MSWTILRLGRVAPSIVALAASAFATRTAQAHIDLEQPLPRELGSSREPNSDLKQGPCGQVSNGRTSRVSVFAPGETIEVTWTETINHRSYYRVAFDRDGDDAFPTFPGSGRGAQGIDPRGLCPVDGQVILAYELDDGSRGTHTLRVTLPSVECERCTLQVVQYMFDANNPYYFQCADLALRRPAGADAGAASLALDAGLVDAAGSSEPEAAPGCFARIAPLDAGRDAPPRDDMDALAEPAPAAASDPPAERPPAEPRPAMSNAPATDDGGGCAIDSSPRNGHGAAWGWTALLAAAWRLARSRTRRAQPRGHSAEAHDGA